MCYDFREIGTDKKYLFTTDRIPMTDQTKGTVCLMDQYTYCCYSGINEGLLTETWVT